MARIEATTHVQAPPDEVWALLTDWDRQSEWMQDARSVAVRSEHRVGTEVAISVRTDIAAGVASNDEMVTTEWIEHKILGVRHVGWLIRGVGAFELEPTEHGTKVVWWEEVVVPFGFVGDAVASVAVTPWVTRVLRASLADFKRLCERAHRQS